MWCVKKVVELSQLVFVGGEKERRGTGAKESSNEARPDFVGATLAGTS